MGRSGQFRGQKGLGPLEKSRELAQKNKIISPTFQLSGTLVILCPKEIEIEIEREREQEQEQEGDREQEQERE